MISACRRDMSLPVTTTSHVASRPNTSEAPATAYSRPSVRLTTRPPVFPVLPALAFAACASICGRLTASTYWVLPERRSSTNVNSFGPTCTLSPCSSGVGSAPRRTPLMRTSASGTAFRITTCPSGVPSNSACLGRTSAPPTCMAQPASLPRATVPGGMVNFLPPSSSNDIGSTPRGKIRAGNYSRSRNHATDRGLRALDFLLHTDQSAAQPAPEQHRPEDHRRITVDEPPDERVARDQRTRHVERHHRRRQQLGEPRRPGRRREVEQEGDEGLQQQNVDEIRVNSQAAQRDIAGQQLVGVRRPREHDGPNEGQEAPRGRERHHAFVGPVDPGAQAGDAAGDALVAALEPRG